MSATSWPPRHEPGSPHVLSTRGRLDNRLHVVTGQPDSPNQTTPEAVLGKALATRASEQAATAEMDAALDAADHPARLIYLYEQITATQRAADLDNAFAARLSRDDYARYSADPARAALHQAIRETQLAGHDTAAIVEAITQGTMTGARSVASWASQLPEARTEGPARACAEAMDERTRAIGEQLAEHPEHWVLDRLGVPRPSPARSARTGSAAPGKPGTPGKPPASHHRPEHPDRPRPEGDLEKAAAWDRAALATERGNAIAAGQPWPHAPGVPTAPEPSCTRAFR